MAFRLNQRVCCVNYRQGTPYLQIERVTRVTTRTYYVADAKRPCQGWFGHWQDAIEEEYSTLCRMAIKMPFPFFKAATPPDWTTEDLIACICRLRRLERKLTRGKRSRSGTRKAMP